MPLSPPPKIIGAGLIGSAFAAKLNSLPNNTLIYAAGEANSCCTDSTRFDRDRARLLEALAQHPNYRIVYFSTMNMLLNPNSGDPYTSHKLAMESHISQMKHHVIFRVAHLVGPNPNPNTVTEFIFNKINQRAPFQIWNNAWRSLIDVQDLVSITIDILKREPNNARHNITANWTTAPQIVKILESVLGQPAYTETVDKGTGKPNIDISSWAKTRETLNLEFNHSYTARLLSKYYQNRDSVSNHA